MKNYLALFFLVITLTITAQNTLKYNSNLGSPDATIEEVSWISGSWQGEALGGITEEIWSNPLGDSLMGMFKLVKDGKVVFYELCTISQENNSIILKIKHFGGDLKGWEEKDEYEEFPLVKIEPNKAFFNDLTFERINDSALNIYVVFKDGQGVETEMKFPYTLKK